MKRCLIYNFSGDVDEISHLFPSERFARLAAILAEEGVDAEILDRANFHDVAEAGAECMANLAALSFEGTNERHRAAVEREAVAVLARNADALFINLWHGTGFKFSLDLLRRLRELAPALPVYGIGQKVDEIREDILHHTGNCLDGLVAGLGYNAVRRLARGDAPASVPNLYLRDGDRVRATPAEQVNVDDYPLPVYADAVYRHIAEKAPIYPVTLSNQACPNRCAFCIRPQNYGRTIVRRRVATVMQELRDHHGERGATHFRIEDSTPPPGALTELAAAIVASELHGRITLSAFSRVDMNAVEDFALLKRAGVLSLFFGIESLDDDVLRRLRKGTTYEAIRATLARAHAAGILTVGSFIFPTPGVTEQSMRRTLARMAELKPVLDSVLVLPAGVQPHTAWATEPEAFGVRLAPDYIREVMIYPIRYLVPIQQWKPFPCSYDLMGKPAADVTFDDIIAAQSRFLAVVRGELGMPGIPDYYYLAAHLVGGEPRDVLQRIVGAMVRRDYAALRAVFRT